MAGLGLRLYTDEDVTSVLAEQLRRRGYDVVSCLAAGNAGQRRSDEWQLSYPAQQGRAILTHIIADFVALGRRWSEQGRAHRGIILAEQTIPIGELVRRTQLHLDTVPADEPDGVVRYLAR